MRLVARIKPTGIKVASRCSKAKRNFQRKNQLFSALKSEYVYFRSIFVPLFKCESYALLVFNLKSTYVHCIEFSVRHHTDIDNNVIL